MNKTISIIRIAILLLTSTIAFFGIIAEPAASANWTINFLLSKIVGFGFGYITYLLYSRWKDDQLISRFEAWSNDTNID